MKRYWRRIFLIIPLLLSLSYAGTLAYAAPAPKYAELETTAAVIDISREKTLQLNASVFPPEARQALEWKSSNKSIATVSSTGKVTARTTGKVYIYVRPKGINKIKRCTVTIKDSTVPTSIAVPTKSYKLTVGQSVTALASAKPETASQAMKWKSDKPSVASVSSVGVITAKKVGSARIRVYSARSSKVYATINVTVARLPAPKTIVITPADKAMNVGEELALTAIPSPSTASGSVRWSSSNTKIATVSSAGVVRAKTAGTVKITATSTVKSSVRTVRTLTISDPYTVKTLTINQGDLYLGIGDSVPLTVTVTPSTAVYTVSWKSSNSAAVTIDKNGKVTARASGASVIEAKAGKYVSKITVAVIDTDYATEMPERTTPVSGISANLSKIDAIHQSVHRELTSLVGRGKLTAKEAGKRKTAIDTAFSMYRFPWMTKVRQRYWSTTDPSKAYQPNVIYYGMPYTQTNRQYDLKKALNGNYFTKSGSYYTMNQGKKVGGLYVGSDCSSFLSMSIWGTSHSASYLRTYNMVSSPYYKTVSGAGNLLPGDTLVKSHDHAVMFLYYTNSAKTHMMIIEQGGGTEPNTVAARHRSVSRYLGNGYVIRRPLQYK